MMSVVDYKSWGRSVDRLFSFVRLTAASIISYTFRLISSIASLEEAHPRLLIKARVLLATISDSLSSCVIKRVPGILIVFGAQTPWIPIMPMIMSTPAEMQVKFRIKCEDRAQNWLYRPFFSLFLFIPLFFTLQCSGEGRLVEEANHWKSLGQYDLALERLQRAYRMAPENPQIRADLGRILSLKRISVYSGLGLMSEALKEIHEPELREDLLLLYLDLERYQDAREMLAPDRVPIEQFFSPGMVILRSGVHCISKPDKRNIQTLQELDDHELRDYYLGRCYLEGRNDSDYLNKAKQLLEKMGDTPLACRLVVLFPGEIQKKDGAISEKVAACKELYPGDIAIARERPIGGGSDDGAQQRLMFSDEFFIPPYPDTDYKKWVKETERFEEKSAPVR